MLKLLASLKESMTGQLIVLNEFSEYEKKLKLFVEEHNWNGLNDLIKKMQPLSEKIDAIDMERTKAYKAICIKLKQPDNSNFYQIAVNFPHEEREACVKLYQDLKIAVIRIQSITWSIDNYVRTVTGAINQVLNNIFPHRKGNIYCSKGNIKQSAGIDAVLINRHS